jgi:hypothetical protein
LVGTHGQAGEPVRCLVFAEQRDHLRDQRVRWERPGHDVGLVQHDHHSRRTGDRDPRTHRPNAEGMPVVDRYPLEDPGVDGEPRPPDGVQHRDHLVGDPQRAEVACRTQLCRRRVHHPDAIVGLATWRSGVQHRGSGLFTQHQPPEHVEHRGTDTDHVTHR